MEVRITFGFSLYTVPLDTQDIVGRQVYQKIEDVLLLTLEVGDILVNFQDKAFIVQ